MSSPTETERCIESLIAVFQRYAGRDGNRSSLSKTEFLTFMNTELAAFTKVLPPTPPPDYMQHETRRAEWLVVAAAPRCGLLFIRPKGGAPTEQPRRSPWTSGRALSDYQWALSPLFF